MNGMGGTPVSELAAVYRKLHGICEARGIAIVRNLIDSNITSLEMQGCSITLLKMDDDMIRLWDAPVSTPALRWGIYRFDQRARAGCPCARERGGGRQESG
jgi:dihydroxyacetone kinase-like protein